MATVRTPIDNGGWFDEQKAVKFPEHTWWNGNNHVGNVTGSEFEHEVLFYTKSGCWVRHHWSNWQGSKETYLKISEEEAVGWMVRSGIEDYEIEDLPDQVKTAVTEAIAKQEI